MRIHSEWKQPIKDGQLLIVSPFDNNLQHATAQTAQKRNDFIASIAEKIVIIHAEPDSKLKKLQ